MKKLLKGVDFIMAKKLEIPLQKAPSVAEAYASLIGGDSGVINLPTAQLDEISDQPFKINEEKISQIAESIRSVGVLEPLIVRQKENGRYDILSGRHRFRACKELGMAEIPCFVKAKLSDEMARFILIATNTDRNNEYPPSVYARAYKEQMELYKKLGKSSADLASSQGITSKTIYRYIRLNNLIPAFLDKVDSGEISFVSGVELSYYDEESQETLLNFIGEADVKLSLDFIKKLRKEYSELTKESLNEFCFGNHETHEVKKTIQPDVAETESSETDSDSFDDSDDSEETDEPHEEAEPMINPPIKFIAENGISEKERLESSNLDFDGGEDYDFGKPELDETDEAAEAPQAQEEPKEAVNENPKSDNFEAVIKGYILLAFDEVEIEPPLKFLESLFYNYSSEDARERFGIIRNLEEK